MSLQFEPTKQQLDGLASETAAFNAAFNKEKPVTEQQFFELKVGQLLDGWNEQALRRRAAAPENQTLLLQMVACCDDPAVAAAVEQLRKAVAAAQ